MPFNAQQGTIHEGAVLEIEPGETVAFSGADPSDSSLLKVPECSEQTE